MWTKNVLAPLAVCAGTVLGTAQANAADGFAAGGHWVAERGMFIFFNQETVSVPNELQIDIEIDDSNHPALFIKMTETYIPGASTGYHVDERIVKAKTFNVVGAVSYANDRIVWGDVDDTTVWSCDIVSVDRLVCLASEPGVHAVSGSIVLTRSR